MPKKTKEVKFTDRNKAWNKKNKTSRYKIDSKAVRKVILIVTEGLTEKLYFGSFRVPSLSLKIIDLQGQSKLRLIEATAEIEKNSEVDYDEVWCVFDMDIRKGDKELADYDNAIHKANDLGYHSAYSNDAFEVWFYLHYHYTDQEKLRTFYYKFLSEQWNINYEKYGKKRDFSKRIFQLLKDDDEASQSRAIKNAKKLFDKQRGLAYHKQNPISQVYKLVELLNANVSG